MSSDDTNEQIPDDPYLAFLAGFTAGEQEAARKARERILLQTPQSLLMRTEGGQRWLEEHPIARLANDLAHYYFDLACIVSHAARATASMRRRAEEEVLSCARARMLPPKDTVFARRTVFLGFFAESVEKYYRTPRMIYTASIREDELPSDPVLAAERRRELEERRDRVLLPGLAPRAAEVCLAWFCRLYPDEREKIDQEKLAKAVEAFGQDKGNPGRKPKGTKSKYTLLQEALKDTSFVDSDDGLEGPTRRAFTEHEQRRVRRNNVNEPWLPPEHFADQVDE